jgi:hypothetical protein
MKHQKIDDSAKVWVVTLGSDGRLCEQFDPQFLTSICTACSSREVADLLVNAAGEMELAENRLW